MRETITEYDDRGRATKTVVREFNSPAGGPSTTMQFVTKAEIAEFNKANTAFIVHLQESYNRRLVSLADQVDQLKKQVRVLQGVPADVAACREQLRLQADNTSGELWRVKSLLDLHKPASKRTEYDVGVGKARVTIYTIRPGQRYEYRTLVYYEGGVRQRKSITDPNEARLLADEIHERLKKAINIEECVGPAAAAPQAVSPLRERLNRVVARYSSISHDARTGIREGQGQPGHDPGP